MGKPIQRLLFLGQYNLDSLTSAPKIRTYQLYQEFTQKVETVFITGWRHERRKPLWKFMLSGGLKKVDAIYLEAATSTSMETDLLLLFLAWLKKIPLGIYIRDAHQLFGISEIHSLKGRLLFWAWLLSIKCYFKFATVIYFPSNTFAQFFQPLNVCWHPLPPGGRQLDYLPLDHQRKVCLYAGGLSKNYGVKQLLEAMALVHHQDPEIQLWIVCRPEELKYLEIEPSASWLHILHLDYQQIAELRSQIYMTIVPIVKAAYSDAAVVVKLWDYMSLGRAVVCSDCKEMAQIIRHYRAGLVYDFSPEDLAAKILELVQNVELADSMARNAYHYIQDTGLWSHRADFVLETLAQSRKEP